MVGGKIFSENDNLEIERRQKSGERDETYNRRVKGSNTWIQSQK